MIFFRQKTDEFFRPLACVYTAITCRLSENRIGVLGGEIRRNFTKLNSKYHFCNSSVIQSKISSYIVLTWGCNCVMVPFTGISTFKHYPAFSSLAIHLVCKAARWNNQVEESFISESLAERKKIMLWQLKTEVWNFI